MTDATNRKLDVENSDEGEISRDDPLFELSQIIGYSQPDGAARKDVAEGEQIDLEAELLRELENYPGYQTASGEGAVEETVPATQYDEFEAELSEEELTSADDILPEEQAYGPESTSDPEPEMPGATDIAAAETAAPDLADADTLEAELMDLLGGLGEKVGAPWPTETSAASVTPAVQEQDEYVAEASDQEAMSPQIPADAPDWFAEDGLEEEPAASAPADEDAEILDEFESALSDGLTISLDEMSAEETAQPETEPELEYEEPAPFEAQEDDVAAFEAPRGEAVAFEAPQEEVAAYEPREEDVASYETPDEEAVADEAAREEVASYEALREEIGSFEPAAEPAEAEAEEPFEFDLDLDEEVGAETPEPVTAETEIDEEAVLDDIEMMAEELGADLGADNPPFLETAELPAGDMETMQPLDLPELPEVEETRSAAVDIERELDAALSGYDQYDSGQRDREPSPAISQAAAATAAAADTRLDFDMGAFEDDLARDLEFVDHDMSAKDGGETEENAQVIGMSAPAATPLKPKRGMMIAAVVGGIAIIGAIAAFSLTGQETGGDGAPVLVKADPDPVKVVPEDPGGKQVPNQDRAVYGEVDGITETQPSQESLVSTSEEPIDLTGAGSEALPNGVTEAGKGEDRLLPESAEATEPAVSTESPTALLTPRRVRTVIVKPDGTFVETEQPEAPAVAATTPAEPQTPPAGSAAETIRKIDIAPAPAPLEPPAAQTETATAAPEPADTAEPGVEMTPSENAALETLATASEPQAVETTAEPPAGETVATAPRAQPIRTPTSIPERPVDQPVNIVNPQQTQTARATEPAQVPTQQTSSGYSVQIASQPSVELAQQTAQNLSQRYSDILGGRAITIQTAEIEGRGTFHRVRVAATSRQDAVALCEAYKRAGGSCFVAR